MKNKINFIISTLNKFFPNPKISLENWQNNFQLLIAVLLSGHSTDKATNSVTKILFQQIKTPKDCLLLGENQISSLIKSVGLSQRKAYFIYHLSQDILTKFNNEVPNNLIDLISLPGVGRKTANVVLSQGFNQNTFPVDTHIIRLANRWKLSNTKNPIKVEADLIKIFPPNLFSKLHLQFIFYGRKYCPARFHKIDHCPICLHLKNQNTI